MNRFNFNQSVGFPFETDILADMQTAYELFKAFGWIVGNFSIIQGCEANGNGISDGVVFINGEPLPFKGGVPTTNVIIVETKQSLEFEDGNSHEVKFIRHAQFGSATTQYPWADFKRGFETKNIPKALAEKATQTALDSLISRIAILEAKPSNIPLGLIAIWGRPLAEIPAGWEEYVNLRGRMPVGLNPDDPDFANLGSANGSKSKTLSIGELPSHFFKYMKAKAGRGYRTASDDFPFQQFEEANTNTIGGDQPFSIMNPYRIVHFIIYKG
ncbi:hypothetical protein SAMN06265349_101739 [Flavobacterium resistens]|uniref:Uncharacterized protein n=1 Tax=Flavobacterium resistens TaxID=443612 RepID=A0A521B6U8_9FLAO|nr:hypothetical protein [Flavobacterium resistens]MRX70259.1 hypothetical protein [Flavobacterium resistens]SMO42785.1 hypothetical protein SAMN06265349_101739 [Flavobacterium resistens]